MERYIQRNPWLLGVEIPFNMGPSFPITSVSWANDAMGSLATPLAYFIGIVAF